MKKKIQQDLMLAMKNADKDRVQVLRLLLSEISKKETEKRYKIASENSDLSGPDLDKKALLDDQEIIRIIFSEINKRKEAIENFKKAKRDDLARQEELEVEILKKYLPDQLSEEKIDQIIQETIRELSATGAKDFGRVMKAVLEKTKNQAEPSLIADKLKKILLSK